VEAAARRQIENAVRPELRSQLCWSPFVAESDMPRLYQNAAAVLYPTLYEGFGLPVVEAQAAGTPILFSDVASLGELRAPGAIILPPNDRQAWISSCQEMIEKRGKSPAPFAPAREWARQYSWDACARRHMEVYRMTARSRPKAVRARARPLILSEAPA
jgi:alpha-1,3-rhamnosyl/mannosyltransferase